MYSLAENLGAFDTSSVACASAENDTSLTPYKKINHSCHDRIQF